MRVIKQRHKTGCGVASLAMLTGISYDLALKLMRPDRKARECACTDMTDMLRTIEKLGFHCDVSFANQKLRSLKKNAILVVVNRPGSRRNHAGLHALVWDADNQHVIDPWRWESKTTMNERYCEKYLVYSITLASR